MLNSKKGLVAGPSRWRHIQPIYFCQPEAWRLFGRFRSRTPTCDNGR